jgi:hypothetical protein
VKYHLSIDSSNNYMVDSGLTLFSGISWHIWVLSFFLL